MRATAIPLPVRVFMKKSMLFFMVGSIAGAACRDSAPATPDTPPDTPEVARGDRGVAPDSPTDKTPEPVSAPVPDKAPEPAAPSTRWTFDQQPGGSGNTAGDAMPPEFEPVVGKWLVGRDDQSSERGAVLTQLASNARPIFNVVLVKGPSYADVDVSVQLRAVKGRIDQGGGVVWRAKDARNYYIARYNPLEDNYRVYTVKDGKRRQLQSATVRADHRAWHTLRITMSGDHIECFLDGDKHLDVRDETFDAPGTIGLWTKADAQTHFDDLVVTEMRGATGDDDGDEPIGGEK